MRPGSKLAKNFHDQPIGYHGRASSIVVSGTPIRRPTGQFVTNSGNNAGPSEKLDFEVEFAAFVGRGNEMGSSIDVADAEEHIFGVVLMNDWSSRDIQMQESAPLGPFNGKNFGTTISPWIVPLEAFESVRTQPLQPEEQKLLPYLDEKDRKSAFDIPIEVRLEGKRARSRSIECG
jgi:fumarylacetoacetase